MPSLAQEIVRILAERNLSSPLVQQVWQEVIPLLENNSAYLPLWQLFQNAPEQQSPILVGIMQVILSSDEALVQRIKGFLSENREEADVHYHITGQDNVVGNCNIINSGNISLYVDPVVDSLEDLRRAYYRSLAADCRHLPLGIVDPRFVTPASEMMLDDIYVDLDVIAPMQEPEEDFRAWDWRLVHGVGEQRTPLLEALGTPMSRCTVLLGDPGSGKTTFINYVTRLLALVAVGEIESSNLPTAWSGLFPVRWVLRDVAESFANLEGRAPAEAFWMALKADITGRLGMQVADQLLPHLQAHLLSRGGVFLLDGLDEVPEAGQRRTQILATTRALLDCLPPNARLVLTARPYAYADPAWQLPGLPVLALAPFSEVQVQHFVAGWMQAARSALGWSISQAEGRAMQLAQALAERPYLADLASRPLLLTLMATLHFSWGHLPEDRADLYEESVKLLLARWQQARTVQGPNGTPIQEPGIEKVLGLGEAKLRKVVEKLAFETQVRQRDESSMESVGKDGPADISQAELLSVLAPVLPTDLNPIAVLQYLETRAGLLLERREGVYAFPHRSFQEYLAACALVNRAESGQQFRDLCRADSAWWREVFLLGVGKKRQGGLGDAVALVNMILPLEVVDVSAPQPVDLQLAVLAGQALIELGFPGRAVGEPIFEALLRRTQRWLAALVSQGQLSIKERWVAGDVLGVLGDPRCGVGVCTNRVPDINWVEIPAGPFVMGSSDDDKEADEDEKPQHTLELPTYHISLYPITNAQFRPFVESDGYSKSIYWTVEGWAWRQGAEADFSFWDDYNDDDFKIRYKKWLADRPKEKRDRPFWWDDPLFGVPNRPVVGITWYEAMAYSVWLSYRLGQCVHLPSEAEWEKSARGPAPATKRYPWGSEWQKDCGNTKEVGLGQTCAVGMFPGGASQYGVLDLLGGVWEWTRSRYGNQKVSECDYPYPYTAEDGREQIEGMILPIVRGGSWLYEHEVSRCTYRGRGIPFSFSYTLGLRVVLF